MSTKVWNEIKIGYGLEKVNRDFPDMQCTWCRVSGRYGLYTPLSQAYDSTSSYERVKYEILRYCFCKRCACEMLFIDALEEQ
jgi:hypothetical protein